MRHTSVVVEQGSVQARHFDAFLSHNSQDKPAVRQIAQWLQQEAGLKVWLDEWNLVPGEAWQEELEEALDQSKACLIFLGPNGLGSWQNEEMRTAIDERVSQQSLRVVPVLLPKTRRPTRESRLPKFLRRLTWVEFKRHIDEEDALHRLLCGIRGVAPGPSKSSPSPQVCPFRGLEVFREEDAPFFFGRESIVQQLLNHLAENRFLALIGPSGSGKSSVVRAGLIPALKERACRPWGEDSKDQMLVAGMTPKGRPLQELAFALRRLQAAGGLSPQPADRLAGRLLESASSLPTICREIVESAEASCCLLVVDQFEELFTQSVSQDEKRQFVRALLSSLETQAQPGLLRIVLTMRSDFLGRCAADQDLNTHVIDNLFQLGPMSEEDLRRAIEEPARLAGLAFEEGLTDQILQDARGAASKLPLVEHGLQELYENRRGNLLTRQAYREMDGIQGAIARRADQAYEKLNRQEREILRKMFVLRLVQPGEGTEDTRRRATKDEVLALGGDPELAEGVLRKWADTRLLTTASQDGRELVDVVHESVIRQWGKVQEWLKDERENSRLIGNLRRSAREWDEKGRDSSYLYRGALLSRVEELFSSYSGDLTRLEKDFAAEAVAQRDRRARELEEQRRRELEAAQSLAAAKSKANRALWVVASVVGAALIGFALFLFQLQRTSFELQETLSRNYWENGRQAMSENDLLLGLHLMAEAIEGSPQPGMASKIVQDMSPGLAAIHQFPHPGPAGGAVLSSAEDRILSWSGDSAYIWDVRGRRLAGPRLQHEGKVLGAAFAPDEKRILTWSQDSTARLWDAANGRQVGAVLQHQDQVLGACFSPDGQSILTWSKDSTARLWDGASNSQTVPSLRHQQEVLGAAFSSQGNSILTWSNDFTARIWEAASGKQIMSLEHQGPVNGAFFSADERRILTWSSDNNAVQLWDASSGRPSGPPLMHDGRVRGALFSGDESRILSWGEDRTVRLWDAVSGRQAGPSLQHEGTVNGALFTAGEERILTWSEDFTARIWEASSGRQVGPALRHEGPLRGATVSADEKRLLTWGGDGTARLWEADGGRRLLLNMKHQGDVHGAAFTADTKHVLSWGEDSTVHLWNANGRAVGLSLPHQDMVRGAAFSADGSRVLTWSDDSTARLWDARDARPAGRPLEHGEPVWGAAFSKDGQKILTWGSVSTARLWDASSGNPIGPPLQHQAWVKGAAFSADGQRILTWSDDASARLWAAQDGRPISPSLQHQGPLRGAEFSADESLILTWSEDGSARLWDASDGRPVGSPLQARQPISGAAFSPDDKRVLTWSEDSNQIQVWEAASQEAVGVPLQHKGFVRGAAFLSDASRVLSWSEDSTARLWEVESGGQIGPSLQHQAPVSGAIASADQSRILTWGEDGTARLWDASSGRPAGPPLEHEDWVTGARFSADQSRLLTWSDDFKVRLWDLASGHRIGPELTHQSWVNGALLSGDEQRVLSWSGYAAVLWDVPGDLDFPRHQTILQLKALTRTAFDPGTLEVKPIPLDEFQAIRQEYLDIARQHARECRYPRQNLYLRFFAVQDAIQE